MVYAVFGARRQSVRREEDIEKKEGQKNRHRISEKGVRFYHAKKGRATSCSTPKGKEGKRLQPEQWAIDHLSSRRKKKNLRSSTEITSIWRRRRRDRRRARPSRREDLSRSGLFGRGKKKKRSRAVQSVLGGQSNTITDGEGWRPRDLTHDHYQLCSSSRQKKRVEPVNLPFRQEKKKK